MSNLYETLGVPKNATPEQLKRARKSLAMSLHPDRAKGDPERMAAVNRAYEILSDPERRSHYDSTGSAEQPKTIDREAFELIVTGVRQLVNAGQAGNLSQEISRQIFTAIAKASAEIGRIDAVCLRCTQRIGMIQNPDHEGSKIIIQGLESLQAEQMTVRSNVERQKAVLTRATELLDGVMESTGFGTSSASTFYVNTQV